MHNLLANTALETYLNLDAAPKGVPMSQVRAFISAAFIRGNWSDMVAAYLNRDMDAAACMFS